MYTGYWGHRKTDSSYVGLRTWSVTGSLKPRKERVQILRTQGTVPVVTEDEVGGREFEYSGPNRPVSGRGTWGWGGGVFHLQPHRTRGPLPVPFPFLTGPGPLLKLSFDQCGDHGRDQVPGTGIERPGFTHDASRHPVERVTRKMGPSGHSGCTVLSDRTEPDRV